MDDPWDVKSVRFGGQYTSCMKINGVPLLPPVLSKECRQEMQYYKLLAKEVEKRISVLEPYGVASGKESLEDRSELNSIVGAQPTSIRHASLEPQKEELQVYMPPKEDVTVDSSQLIVDFSLRINQTNTHGLKTLQSKSPCPPEDLPERDYNCTTKLLDPETKTKSKVDKARDGVDISFRIKNDDLSKSLLTTDTDGLKSIGSKNFTGSLNDIFSNINKQQDAKLSRQRSYTVLNPSPQLLAHLEVQSLNTGVDMSKISMSESLSNVSYSINKKRRSWDLESAKMKWSSMALELNQKNISNNSNKGMMQNSPGTKRHVARSPIKGTRQASQSRAKSAADSKLSSTNKHAHKSEPLHNARKQSPLRNVGQKSEPINNKPKPSPLHNTPSDKTIVIESIVTRKREGESPKSPLSPKLCKHLPTANCEDPATRVKELYDKIQKQQLQQMANLVEKQKREQLLLQQVFEEQNNLLFKQLKTICPKSPIEVKEAWGEKQLEAERGPVSLSQLINLHNHKPQENIMESPTSTLKNTNNCIEYCDNVLEKSRKVSSTQKPRSPKSTSDGSRTRTHSPTGEGSTPISRRLIYDTSASSDRELEPMLTDRTNDTMADLNVTFPSDSDTSQFTYSNKRKETSVIHTIPQGCHSTDSAIRSMERTIQNSINSSRRGMEKLDCNPTPEQRAAASVIVAHARGYLVRRLFRTERVQTTVQTIKDALLCALQLHQDYEGIRGADVDLHRRLIQQITAACYSLHDTFIESTPAERTVMIAADRERRKLLANRPVKPAKSTDKMTQSHCGAFPPRPKRSSTSSLMTQSTYENYNNTERPTRARYMPSPRPRPWR